MISKDNLREYKRDIRGIKNLRKYILGGKTREESSFKGLKSLKNEFGNKSKQKVFDVVLVLNQRIEMNFYNLLFHTLTYPFLTLMVYLRIHYQALKLWLRGVKYVDHPKYKQDEGK